MKRQRASGLLLHVTSLPGPFGTGDVGPAAYRFIDALADARQTYWQVLPLGPPGYGESPYSAFSAFAGNTSLVSPELLGAQTRRVVPNVGVADYESAHEIRENVLREVFDGPFDRAGFSSFCDENAWWLNDFALFAVLKRKFNGSPWYGWPAELKLRERQAITEAVEHHGACLEIEKFAQWVFFTQWDSLKRYADQQGVKIIGDVPFFVALDSADVWCNQHLFRLHLDGSPEVVAGVPPDYFSETGQLWGNPIYNWDAMPGDRFSWWTARLQYALRLVDVVRLDHFIGFVRNWQVPGGETTAKNGRWVDVPGRELLEIIRQLLPAMPFIAEDLGSMTAEVEALRDDLGLPGMRILQYGFGGDAANRDLPHNYPANSVAYTGTHDNETIMGWYRSTSDTVRTHLREYLNKRRPDQWDIIRALMASPAETVILPLQDLLGSSNDARMNTPATTTGNWRWRLADGQSTDKMFERLRRMTELFGRDQKMF